MGSMIPHEIAFMMPCTDLSVPMLVRRAAVEPDMTSNVITDERSFAVVGCMVGE